MTGFRRGYKRLFILLLCVLTLVVGTNTQVQCLEVGNELPDAHLQLFRCDILQIFYPVIPASLSAELLNGQHKDSDTHCPSCVDVSLSFLNGEDSSRLDPADSVPVSSLGPASIGLPVYFYHREDASQRICNDPPPAPLSSLVALCTIILLN